MIVLSIFISRKIEFKRLFCEENYDFKTVVSNRS